MHISEVERTNSAIGDALADRGTLDWQKHYVIDGSPEDQISRLTQ